MPKKKASKKKVKHVEVPEGDEGAALSKKDRAEKLDAFIAEFDYEVKERLKNLDKECRAACSAVEHAGRSIIFRLSPEQANMSIADYRKSLLNLNSRAKRESEMGAPNISALLSDVGNLRSKPDQVQPPAKKQQKVAGFATPAFGRVAQTPMWTATPEQTPQFDKRLLNVTAGKPSGLSFYGQPINLDSIDELNKKKLVSEMTTLLKTIQG